MVGDPGSLKPSGTRLLDEEGMETIYSEVLPPEGIGLAVMNRLGRAAAFRKIQV
jgi:L-threonylcarbamoyladenylate synthase